MAGIFKAYDIRGICPSELNEEMARKIGQAFGTMKKGKILIATDVRKSSPALKKAFVEGLLSTGATVVDAGILTTPATMFAVRNFGMDAGAMITASHNPPEYNGIKLFGKGGAPLSYETGIGEIEKLAASGKFSSGFGKTEKISADAEYISHITSKIKTKKKLKIVADCMNGCDGKFAPAALRALGIDVIELRTKLNGDFPADGPDPSKTHNIEILRKKVLEEKADAGFAYDGDGDRLAIIDEKGNFIDPKFVFSILVKNAAAENPKVKIVYDALTSQTVLDSISSSGGIPIACRVGRSYIPQKLLEGGAEIGGEISGHYYFRELNGADNALFASMKIFEYLARTGKKLSEIVAGFNKYFYETVRLPVNDIEKFAFIDKLKLEFSSKYNIDTLDGVRVKFDGGWATFRCSNTEPKISIAFEAADKQKFEEIKNFVSEIVERIPK